MKALTCQGNDCDFRIQHRRVMANFSHSELVAVLLIINRDHSASSSSQENKNENIFGGGKRKESPQWNRCFASVSFGMNSATSSLSSPSQQQPNKLTNLLLRS